MNIGIGIDDYKKDAFEKGLTEAGFEFETVPGVTKDSLFITVKVKTDDMLDHRLAKLEEVVKRLNRETSRARS